MSFTFSLHTLLAVLVIGTSLLVGVRFYYYYDKDGFNPVSLFMFGWVLAYGLYLLYPYPPAIQPRLSLFAHAVIVGATGSFFLGWLIANIHMPLTLPDHERGFQTSNHSLELAIVVMLILALIAFVIQFRDVGGLQTLLQNQQYYETHFWRGALIDDVYNLGLIAGSVGMMYALRRRLNILAVIAVGIGLFLSVIPLGRQYTLMYLVLLLISMNYYWHQFRLRTIASVGGAGIGLMVTVAQMLSWGLVSGSLARAGVIVSPVITHIYWYYAMGIRNVELTISKLSPLGQGEPILTFKPIWAVLFLKDEAGVSDLVFASQQARGAFYEGWTTPTFIRPFYSDFGVIGVFVGIFLIGYLTTRWYIHLRTERTPFRVFTYALFAYGLLLLFFTNHFTNPRLLITIIQFILLIRVLRLSDSIFEEFREYFRSLDS